METYKFDGYTMTLDATGKTDRHNHIMVKYEFINPDGVILFEGEDLGASPLHDPEGMETAKALLSFLTLKKGDTDEEYFDNYTPEQLAFSESFDCEQLQAYTWDDES